MPCNDEERREVAHRLRKHSGAKLFTGDDVERLIGAESSGFRPEDADKNYNLLADLIEPPTQCPYYHSDRHHCSAYDDVVDRDALLALADDMEQKEPDFGSSDSNPPYVKTVYASLLPIYAHRIRKALGVTDGD